MVAGWKGSVKKVARQPFQKRWFARRFPQHRRAAKISDCRLLIG